MTSPWSNPPQLPTGPRADDDPTGLRYDRADLGQEPTISSALPAGVEGFAPDGRRRTSADVFTVQLKGCCGEVLVGEECDCAAFAAELDLAPVYRMQPFNLRELAEQHTTAAEVDRRERGVA